MTIDLKIFLDPLFLSPFKLQNTQKTEMGTLFCCPLYGKDVYYKLEDLTNRKKTDKITIVNFDACSYRKSRLLSLKESEYLF